MNNCKYKKICNRHSSRVINCNFPSLCEYKERYSNYDALFSQESRGEIKRKVRVSGFNLEEEVLDMINLNGFVRQTWNKGKVV